MSAKVLGVSFLLVFVSLATFVELFGSNMDSGWANIFFQTLLFICVMIMLILWFKGMSAAVEDNNFRFLWTFLFWPYGIYVAFKHEALNKREGDQNVHKKDT